MALSLEISKETIDVVSSKDGAVTCDKEGYKRYLDTLDETHLGLTAGVEPTRFVLRMVLPYGITQKIKSDQASFDGEGKPQMRLGFMMDELRASLVDVKNPGSKSLEFKKDSDGYASRDIIALLETTGILTELYSARQNAMQTATGPSKKS